jgi:hypothetical protein
MHVLAAYYTKNSQAVVKILPFCERNPASLAEMGNLPLKFGKAIFKSLPLGSEGKVYAFEPEPTNHSFLKENVRLNGRADIFCAEKVVCDRKGKARLFLNRRQGGAYDNRQHRRLCRDRISQAG